MNSMTRYVAAATAGFLAAVASLPVQAAPPPTENSAPDTISFDQWELYT